MKQLKTALSASLAAVMLSGMAFATEIGVVDMQLISQRYSKAQTLAGQVKDKENELQEMRDRLAQQLKNEGDAMSPVAKKALEDRLNEQFANKFKEYRAWTVEQEQVIKADFDRVIQQVAASKNLELVLPKQTVLQGGQDITNDVINQLNR